MEIGKRAELKSAILKNYGRVAESSTSGCCGSGSSCCGSEGCGTDGRVLGYTEEDLASVPEGANLGLGCGNPQAIARLRPGERVLDLGSGAGFDAFLAARRVGPKGKVIGVDMTPGMVAKARQNAIKGGYGNVEFRLGEIENLPLGDRSVDVIISNCVINLSTDKPAVFAEAFRVLEPGGRLAVSDVVATAALPDDVREDPLLHSACIAGASTIDDLATLLREAGFAEIGIEPKDSSKAFIKTWVPGSKAGDYLVSATIRAMKPKPFPPSSRRSEVISMKRVLFLCVHNSARSQMAEAYLAKLGGDRYAAESAGLEPGKLNPYVVRALAEDGIDIAGKTTRAVIDLYRQGKTYDCVVTVCSKEAAERCPVFPGKVERRHWPFDDPSQFTGSDEEIMARVRDLRDAIRAKIGEFIVEFDGR